MQKMNQTHSITRIYIPIHNKYRGGYSVFILFLLFLSYLTQKFPSIQLLPRNFLGR